MTKPTNRKMSQFTLQPLARDRVEQVASAVVWWDAWHGTWSPVEQQTVQNVREPLEWRTWEQFE